MIEFHGQHDQLSTLRVCVFPKDGFATRGGGALVGRAYDFIAQELPESRHVEAGVDGIYAVMVVKTSADMAAIHQAAERVSERLAKLKASVDKAHEPLP
jgi:hypothetical protein